MRFLADVGRPLWLRASARPLVAVGLATAGVVLALTAGARVGNLQVDPSLPGTRVTIVVACVASNLMLAWTRPVLPLHEHLAARVGWSRRLAAALAGIAVPVALTFAVNPRAGDVVPRLAGFVGLGLGFAALAPGLGVVVPWAYAISGLAFGYTTQIDGPAQLQPWAWMVGDQDPWQVQAVLLGVGLMLFTWREPRVPTILTIES